MSERGSAAPTLDPPPDAIRVPRRETMVDATAKALIRLIARRHLRGGDRLPSERELIDMLGVSRLPLREALSVLKGIGILDAHHGKGVFLKHLDIASVFSLLSPLLKAQASIGVPEIIEARAHLEPAIAALAAQHRTEAHLGELHGFIARMRQHLDDRATFIDSDVAFHQCLARAAKNPIFHVFMAALTDLLREVQFRYPDQLKHRAASLAFHERIAAAVNERNPAAASAAMRDHIRYIAERL